MYIICFVLVDVLLNFIDIHLNILEDRELIVIFFVSIIISIVTVLSWYAPFLDGAVRHS